MPISRRNFLQAGFLTTALSPGTLLAGSTEKKAPPAPRRIIFMVADGMSMGTFSCSDHLSQILRHRPLAWARLFDEPGARHGWMNMRSLNSLVTDSSAASSSWGSGSRIANGAVNILPDGTKLRTLYSLLGEAGWKRGLVTTTEITHATPAGFATVVTSRSHGETIAAQYLKGRVELLLGGGSKHFRATDRGDKRDLHGEFAEAGYTVARDQAELMAAPKGKPLLGTFASGHLPYTIDHMNDARALARIPTLQAMTRVALEHLQEADHFILQVEGGRVDHGCHANDAAAAFHDQIAFDEAVEVCLEFARNDPETLVLITSDHGTANPGLNGMGDSYAGSSTFFGNLPRIKHSFDVINEQIKPGTSAATARGILAEMTGYDAGDGRIGRWLDFIEKRGNTLYGSMNSVNCQLGQLLANYIGVGWTSGAHTSDYVLLSVVGAGAHAFGGFVENTSLFHRMLKFADIDFQNPEGRMVAGSGMTAEEAEGMELPRS